jgi:hypothetical protein
MGVVESSGDVRDAMNEKSTMRIWTKQPTRGVRWVWAPVGVAEWQHTYWVRLVYR